MIWPGSSAVNVMDSSYNISAGSNRGARRDAYGCIVDLSRTVQQNPVIFTFRFYPTRLQITQDQKRPFSCRDENGRPEMLLGLLLVGSHVVVTP
jgi:hypothetical protein